LDQTISATQFIGKNSPIEIRIRGRTNLLIIPFSLLSQYNA